MPNPTPYYGEFLISPIPLELSFNWCSFRCSYCFANLNVPNRKANIPSVARFLADYRSRKTLEALLYRMGYATCVSNLVDIFAPSNFQEALPIVRLMHDLGLPLQFQTRGSNNQKWEDELLDSLNRPSVWYISVTMLDDDLRKTIEPGATRIHERFAFMEQLRQRGHRVVLGLNPLTRQWCPDPQALIDRAVDAGAEGMWTEMLHMNYRQIRNMPPRDRAAIGEDMLAASQRRRPLPADMEHFLAARQHAIARGLQVFSVGQGCYSRFPNIYHETYPGATFLTLQDFVNACIEAGAQGQLIPFEVFADFFTVSMPAGVWPIDSYLGAVAHNLWWEYHVPPQMSYRQLLSVIWRQPKIKNNPARMPCFAYAARWDDGAEDGKPGWVVYVDEHDHPYLLFNPDGFTDYYTHVDLPGATDAVPASDLEARHAAMGGGSDLPAGEPALDDPDARRGEALAPPPHVAPPPSAH